MAAIEFQVSRNAYLAAQKAILQGTKFCPPVPIEVGSVQIVVDRISFDDNALRHDQPETFTVLYRQAGQTIDTSAIAVPGFQTQLAQTVTVYVAAYDDILANPNGTPDVVVPIQCTIVVNVDFYASGQTCSLAFSFGGLELGPLPVLPANFDPKQIPLPITSNDITAALNPLLLSLIPNRVVPFDIAGLLQEANVTLDPLTIVNAGISVESQSQFLALHIEIGAPAVNPDVPWRDFYNGVVSDRLQGSDWSLYVDGDYLASILQTFIDRAASGALPDNADLFVKSTYSNAGGQAVIMTDLLGVYHLPGDIGNVSHDFQIPITFSVPAQSFVAADIGIPDIAEIEALLEDLVPPFLFFLKPLVELLIVSALSGFSEPVPPGCKRTSPSNVHCETYVPLPVVPNVAAPVVTGLLGLADGIAVTGSMREQPYTLGTLDISTTPFQFTPPVITCGGAGPEIALAFANSPSSFEILRAEIVVSYDGTLPVWLCGVTPINDRLGVFPASAISWDSAQATLTITVHPPIPPAIYYTAGGLGGTIHNPAYPCDLLVVTTAGSRLVQIPGPPLLTQPEIDKLTALLVAKLASCEQLIDPWFKLHQGYNPLWGVDPMRGEIVDHLWQVTVRGLGDGETVTLRGTGQQELVTATARAGEALRLSALVAPADQDELSILHGAPSSAAPAVAPDTMRGIEISQQLIIQLGTIRFAQPSLGARAMLMMGKPTVLAVTRDGAVAFDFTDPQRPIQIGGWQKPGIRGARKWNTGMLLFGEDGLEVIDSAGARIWSSAKCGCEPQDVIAAAVGSGWVYAVLREAMHIYTPRLNLVRTMPLDGCRSAVLVSGKLVLAGRNGLSLYDVSQPDDPRPTETDDAVAIVRLEMPLDANPGTFLATGDDGSIRLLRLDGSRFQRRPGFRNDLGLPARCASGVLIRTAVDGTSLEIRRFGPFVVS